MGNDGYFGPQPHAITRVDNTDYLKAAVSRRFYVGPASATPHTPPPTTTPGATRRFRGTPTAGSPRRSSPAPTSCSRASAASSWHRWSSATRPTAMISWNTPVRSWKVRRAVDVRVSCSAFFAIYACMSSWYLVRLPGFCKFLCRPFPPFS